MPTYEECRDARTLISIKGNLTRHQLARRVLAAVPEVIEWMRKELPVMKSDGYLKGSVRPVEQAAILFRDYVSGGDFRPPLPHEMKPTGHGVWRIRTPDLRFDGWFPQPCMFIIASAATAAATKAPGRNNQILQEVIQCRNRLHLYDGAFEKLEQIDELIRY